MGRPGEADRSPIANASSELAATRSIQEVATVLDGCWSRLLGPSSTSRLLVPDRRGYMRPISNADGERPRTTTAMRRSAIACGSPITLEREPDRAAASIPMMSFGGTVAIAEVESRGDRLGAALEVMAPILGHAAAVIRSLARWDAAAHDDGGAIDVWDLARTLAEATSSRDAMRSAVSLLHARFGLSVVGWSHRAGRPQLVLAASAGLGPRGAELRRMFRTVSPWSTLTEPERVRFVSRLEGVLGVAVSDTVSATGALLWLAGRRFGDDPRLRIAERLLTDAFTRIAATHEDPGEYVQLELGLAMTAHELRGPLLEAKAAIDAVQSDARLPEGDLAMLTRTSEELGRLALISDGLLRWANGARPRGRQVDLGGVVRAVVDGLEHTAGRSRITITNTSDDPIVVGDPGQLGIAVGNLLRNALAHSEAGVPVRVTIGMDDSMAEVRVIDRGSGVPGAEAERIFDRFVRGRADRANGSGLGLYLSRRIAESHGGALDVESQPKGVTFVLRLPAKRRRRSSAS